MANDDHRISPAHAVLIGHLVVNLPVLFIIAAADFGDTLMMRMWFELKPPQAGFIPPPTHGLVQPFPGMPGASGIAA